MKIIKAAILTGYTPRKDKTITLKFSTQEITPAEIAEIHSLIDEFGYLYFKAQETLTKDEIKELDNLDTDLYDQPKSQSQRIRGVLYLNWMQDNLGHAEFRDFYKYWTNRIIQHFKSKLDTE